MKPYFPHISHVAGVSALAGLFLLSPATVPAADIPTRESHRFGGIYKVVSSSDPMFPTAPRREYFLDFGKGIQGDKLSGSVAISVRENPNVKVRILSWQYFPEQGTMVIGHPYAAGSRKAVVRAAWRMTAASNGLVFERETYTVVMQRPAPGDY